MHEKDFEALLREVLPLAQDKLSDEGEFAPLGGIIKPDGTTELYTGGVDDESTPVDDESVLELLFNEFREMAEAGELRAAAVCFNAEVALSDLEEEEAETPAADEQIQDAIYICLEHESGTAVDVFMPYEKTPGGELGFAELQASDSHNRIWGSEEDAEDDGDSDEEE